MDECRSQAETPRGAGDSGCSPASPRWARGFTVAGSGYFSGVARSINYTRLTISSVTTKRAKQQHPTVGRAKHASSSRTPGLRPMVGWAKHVSSSRPSGLMPTVGRAKHASSSRPWGLKPTVGRLNVCHPAGHWG